MNRRTFFYNAALGTLSLGLGRLRAAQSGSRLQDLKIDLHTPEMPRSPLGMPGLFPGRVVKNLCDPAVFRDPHIYVSIDRGSELIPQRTRDA